MKHKLAWTAIVLSITAATAAVVMPIYVEHEHDQALKRQVEWKASAAEARRQPPSSGCADGHYRVTDYSGSFPVSIPVWIDNGVLECDGDSYSINGKAVSSEEAQGFAKQALNQHRASTERRAATGPMIDAAYIAQVLCESGLVEKEAEPALVELMKQCK